MIRFRISDLLDKQECYDYLLRTLHPGGLRCRQGHALPSDQAPHDQSRAPVDDYRCRVCGNVFNLFTDTVWHGTHYDCVTIVLVMRGFAQGIPTLQLADELERDYGMLLGRRHQIQQFALDHQPKTPFPDPVNSIVGIPTAMPACSIGHIEYIRGELVSQWKNRNEFPSLRPQLFEVFCEFLSGAFPIRSSYA